MSDRLLRFPLTHQAFRLCDHTAHRPERKQPFGGGLRGKSSIGLLGSAAQLTNVGAGPGMFVRVTVVPGEVVVHVRTRFTLSACLHEDAAEQMDDPVGVPAGRLGGPAQHLDRLVMAALAREKFGKLECRMRVSLVAVLPQHGNRLPGSAPFLKKTGERGPGVLRPVLGETSTQLRLSSVPGQESGELLGMPGEHDAVDAHESPEQSSRLVDAALAFQKPGMQGDSVPGVRCPRLERDRRTDADGWEQSRDLVVTAVARSEFHQYLGKGAIGCPGTEQCDDVVDVALPGQQARKLSHGLSITGAGVRTQQFGGFVEPLPIGEQPTDGADSRPPSCGGERLQKRQRLRPPIGATVGNGDFGEPVGAEPVTACRGLAEYAVMAVFVEGRDHGGWYPAVEGAVAVVEIDCVHDHEL